MHARTLIALPLASLAALTLLSGCSSDSEDTKSAPESAAPSVDVSIVSQPEKDTAKSEDPKIVTARDFVAGILDGTCDEGLLSAKGAKVIESDFGGCEALAEKNATEGTDGLTVSLLSDDGKNAYVLVYAEPDKGDPVAVNLNLSKGDAGWQVDGLTDFRSAAG